MRIEEPLVSTSISRRYGLAILLAGAAALSSHARGDIAPEKQILGRWVTQDKDGLIEIYLTAKGTVAGRIVGDRSGTERLDDKNPDPALRTRPLNGAVILQGFRYAGEGRWTDGTVYDPGSGKTYKCSLELKNANTLSVHGYIGLPVFGLSHLWTRKKE
jgi:uncharacterized protein (DUF2147 family)